MKITICGSIAFIDDMHSLKKQLEGLGHTVEAPPEVVPGETGELIPAAEYYKHKKASHGKDDAWIWKDHSQRIIDHFEKVAWSDAVLIANYDKNGVVGYIGPNTLMEMGVAFYLKKPIYLLKNIPELAWQEEILGMKPKLINQDLSKITLQ